MFAEQFAFRISMVLTQEDWILKMINGKRNAHIREIGALAKKNTVQ